MRGGGTKHPRLKPGRSPIVRSAMRLIFVALLPAAAGLVVSPLAMHRRHGRHRQRRHRQGRHIEARQEPRVASPRSASPRAAQTSPREALLPRARGDAGDNPRALLLQLGIERPRLSHVLAMPRQSVFTVCLPPRAPAFTRPNLTRKRPAPGAFHRCQHARCKVRRQPMIRPMISHEQLEPCLTRCVHAQGNQCSELFSRHRRRAQERACAASAVALRTDAVKNASAKEAGRVRALGRWSTWLHRYFDGRTQPLYTAHSSVQLYFTFRRAHGPARVPFSVLLK